VRGAALSLITTKEKDDVALDKYIQRARVFRAVTALVRRAGLSGDMFAPYVPPVGTLGEEWQILGLIGELPRDVRRNPLAWRMIRAAVLTNDEGAR
jgi:hypothetical protein